MEEQGELKARHCGQRHHLLDFPNETNRSLRDNMREYSAQYDQESADFRYESDGLHVLFVNYDSRSKASGTSC